MAKRTVKHALSDVTYTGNVNPQPTKRRKIAVIHKRLDVSKPLRKWSPLEFCFILELMVRSDVKQWYSVHPEANAFLLEAQNWEAVAQWMTNAFSKSDWQLWFKHKELPITPYTASECKQCALNLIKHNYKGDIPGPVSFNALSSMCNAARKQYIRQAKMMVDQNTVNTQIIRSGKVVRSSGSSRTSVSSMQTVQSLSPPKTPKTGSTPTGTPRGKAYHSNREQCSAHLLTILQRLSTYNRDTRNVMHTKLLERYKVKFDKAAIGPKHQLQKQEVQSQLDKDWKQYQKTITEKVQHSWMDNIQKLTGKFGTTLNITMPEVEREYRRQHPADTTILELFSVTATKGKGTAK